MISYVDSEDAVEEVALRGGELINTVFGITWIN